MKPTVCKYREYYQSASQQFMSCEPICELWANKVASCEPMNQHVMKLTVCEAQDNLIRFKLVFLKNMSIFFLNFVFYDSIRTFRIRARYFSYCHVNNISLKCACIRGEVVQLGDVSRRFSCHTDG